MNNEPHVIEINNFTKDYGSGRGTFDINVKVSKGEFFGFLGPNGAGKSTTIRHLMGFSKPDKGELLILGQNIQKNRVSLMHKIGYLPGEVNLPTYLTGNEFVKQQINLQKVKDITFLESLKKEFPIDLSLEIKYMSLGDKRTLAIYSAFMNDPDILILDEPTSGLDPLRQEMFKRFLLKEKSRGKTIFLSSHIFKEIDDTCDRIAIIKDGKIVSDFKKSEFDLRNINCFMIEFEDENNLNVFVNRIGKSIDIIERLTTSIKVKVEEDSINDLFFCLANLDIKSIKEVKESLETYFLSFYKEDKIYEGI